MTKRDPISATQRTDYAMEKELSSLHSAQPRAPLSRSPWLALVALLTACAADGDAMTDPRCEESESDCACASGDAECAADVGDDALEARRWPFGWPVFRRPDAGRPGSVADAGGPQRDAGPNATGDAGTSVGDASTRDGGAATDAGSGPAPTPGAGFVGAHGALRVQKNRVVDRDGRPIQLRGMSLFWSQWTNFYVAKNVDVLVDDWKATVVRAALGVEEGGGYLQDREANLAKVRAVVDRAIARGIYVIIDWHDHHAQDHAAQATAFFEDMARTYGKNPHVIFEIYNEPVNVSWSVVKSYAEPVIRAIRRAGSNNLVIVGTPTWSQDVDLAANDPITSDANVAYTLHFYANTHKQSLRDKAKVALDRAIALFVTEWGTCSADGNGTINESESQTWLRFLQDNGISWANWSLHDKAEACSAVQPSGGSVGPWRDAQLTPSGLLVKRAIP